ncbi:27739_t:CDS:1, partial [Racocetra persica]
VILSREKSTNRLYALKVISKEWVVFRQEVEHTRTERDILAIASRTSHPFLIRLRESFHDSNQLFLVLDYYPGGDIATQLAKWHRFDDARCLFYAAEIVLGIEELHRL